MTVCVFVRSVSEYWSVSLCFVHSSLDCIVVRNQSVSLSLESVRVRVLSTSIIVKHTLLIYIPVLSAETKHMYFNTREIMPHTRINSNSFCCSL